MNLLAPFRGRHQLLLYTTQPPPTTPYHPQPRPLNLTNVTYLVLHTTLHLPRYLRCTCNAPGGTWKHPCARNAAEVLVEVEVLRLPLPVAVVEVLVLGASTGTRSGLTTQPTPTSPLVTTT